MGLDVFKNFAKSTLASGITSGATSLTVASGEGARFPTVSFNAVIWNKTDYGDPADDPNVEIVRVTAISTDTFTITRAQESTTGVAHNTAGKTYGIIAPLTAKTLTSDLAPVDAPSFTTTATITRDALGTTSTDGVIVRNTTTGGAQNSPRVRLSGRTTSDTSSDWTIESRAAGGSNSYLVISAQENAGGYTDLVKIQYNGATGNPNAIWNAPSGHNFNFVYAAGGNNKWYVRNRGDLADQFTWMNSDASGNVEKLIMTQAGALQLPNYGAGVLNSDASGNITSVSDVRLKTDITDFEYGLKALLLVQPIWHRWIPESGMETECSYPGFSAQNVQAAMPEAVSVRDRFKLDDTKCKCEILDENGICPECKGRHLKNVLHNPLIGIVAALVNAVKELGERLAKLEEKVTPAKV